MKLKIKILPLLIYSYIAAPFIIFALGFLRPCFAIPAAAAVLISILLASCASEGLEKIAFNRFDIFKALLGVLIIIAVVLLSGIGSVLWQNIDHATRNTIFDILVKEDWPPIARSDSGELVGLTYYIGFWLPASIVGKLTTLHIGYIFQIVWAAAGLLLIWLLLCSFNKKVLLYPLIIFLFFSGLDVIGHAVISLFPNASAIQIGSSISFGGLPFTYHLEWWSRYFQFSSHITQLFWVFNQALPAWIALLVLLSEKNNKNLVFIMGLTLLSSPFPFVGLLPIFVWCAVTDKEKLLSRSLTHDVKHSFLSLFTFQNIFGGGISGIVTFLYLKGNIASGSSGTQTAASSSAPQFSVPLFALLIALSLLFFFGLYNGDKRKITSYIMLPPMFAVSYLIASLSAVKAEYYTLFIIFELLVFAFCVYPLYGQTSVFYVTVFSLLIIPFFRVGKSIDFCMRVSIPALCLLCLLCIFSLKEYISQKRVIPTVILIVVLALGAVTPAHEIARTCVASYTAYTRDGAIKNKSKSESSVMEGGNFTGKTSGSVFYEILAK